MTTPIEDMLPLSLIGDVDVVDALMFFVHNVERYEFEDLWLPGKPPEYVSEKWNLMHQALPRFWGTLDPENKTRFLIVTQQYYHDKHTAKAAGEG